MKDIKEFFEFNKKQKVEHKDDNWQTRALFILEKFGYAFEEYKEDHPDYNPETDSYPKNFFEDIIKLADKEELFDAVHRLYECYYAGNFTIKDVNAWEKKLTIK